MTAQLQRNAFAALGLAVLTTDAATALYESRRYLAMLLAAEDRYLALGGRGCDPVRHDEDARALEMVRALVRAHLELVGAAVAGMAGERDMVGTGPAVRATTSAAD